MGIAKHQLTAERFFQPLDMLGDGRLADAQPGRRFRETAGLLQHDETIQVMKVQHGYPLP
jgi:hypothetical protein